ncbi:MAG TPA: 50S ribosomal protein L19 [Tepidisphaeraceae bacterium]|jgi:large subunit ribosomal protein L19
MRNKLLDIAEKPSLKETAPQFERGDTVDVHTRIVEGGKERVQIFAGTVIMRKGTGATETFTVRRIVANEGVERIFPIHSPLVEKVVVKRSGVTRRAKLYYLRDRVGKSTRLADKKVIKKADAKGDAKGDSAESREPALAGA